MKSICIAGTNPPPPFLVTLRLVCKQNRGIYTYKYHEYVSLAPHNRVVIQQEIRPMLTFMRKESPVRKSLAQSICSSYLSIQRNAIFYSFTSKDINFIHKVLWEGIVLAISPVQYYIYILKFYTNSRNVSLQKLSQHKVRN